VCASSCQKDQELELSNLCPGAPVGNANLRHCASPARQQLHLQLGCLYQIRPKEDQERVLCSLSAEELTGKLDLRPFMQRHPFVVAADASMSRAYRLFRTMGLRHMFVGPPRPKVHPQTL